MVIVQFRDPMNVNGRLMRQYRACVSDSLRLGITCVYITVLCVQGILLHFLCRPFVNLLVSSNRFNSSLLTILVVLQAAKRLCSNFWRKDHTVSYMYM